MDKCLMDFKSFHFRKFEQFNINNPRATGVLTKQHQLSRDDIQCYDVLLPTDID